VSWVCLLLTPLGTALALAAPLLLLRGRRSPLRVHVVPLLLWSNSALLVVACSSALGWARPG
jgi:hypothetical protein